MTYVRLAIGLGLLNLEILCVILPVKMNQNMDQVKDLFNSIPRFPALNQMSKDIDCME